ncbi:hypothetical protein NDU88_006005 [Pleurodeles waltl]|uniref:Uncharacterized protein n=1 Tax=Pleurodeles waltl TaxID=8319 RepID=A0AAV7QMD8_PLEWA|nr:hypothetical protein NDU88_006005 [Pleurodeles waltl]
MAPVLRLPPATSTKEKILGVIINFDLSHQLQITKVPSIAGERFPRMEFARRVHITLALVLSRWDCARVGCLDIYSGGNSKTKIARPDNFYMAS